MKFFFFLHNPKGKRYAIYYSVVLMAVTGTVVFTTLQYVHQNILQGVMTFFEGFFSLFMLVRNEEVGKAFLAHLSGIKEFLKP